MSFSKTIVFILGSAVLVSMSACKTKSELRREEEFEKVKQEVTAAKTHKADFEVLMEESKTDMSRLANSVEEVAGQHRRDYEETKKELLALTARIQALEQRAVQEELAAKQPPPPAPEKPKASLEAAKKLFDEGSFEEAAEMFKSLSKGVSADAKKAQFWSAESYFSEKEYSTAALEYAEFRKRFPKDPMVPNAIFRQAMCFKLLGKNSESKLFFQDLIERYPKSPFAAKAKVEIKKLK